MQQFIKKWGNGAAVRLPKAVMDKAHLAINATVELRVENGRVVIEPAQQREYTLDELVAGITSQNRHDEIDTGGPVGNETFKAWPATSPMSGTWYGCSSIRNPVMNRRATGRRSA